MFYNVPLSNIVIKHDRDIRWQSCLPIAHIRRRDVDLDLWRHPDDVDKLLGGQEPYDFHTWIPGVFFATGEFALSQWSFRRTLSHCLIAAMFLSIALIFVSYFSCFVLSSWIFRLYIWPHVDFQIFGEKASNEPVKYIISLVFYIYPTPEWLLVPVFLSVQASMTLSSAYSDDCFFNTVTITLVIIPSFSNASSEMPRNDWIALDSRFTRQIWTRTLPREWAPAPSRHCASVVLDFYHDPEVLWSGQPLFETARNRYLLHH